jgi:hypothetical protein
VAVAVVTVARVAPKYTTFLVATTLKLVPVIATVLPTTPEAGEKLVIVGTAACKLPTPINIMAKILVTFEKTIFIIPEVFVFYLQYFVKNKYIFLIISKISSILF